MAKTKDIQTPLFQTGDLGSLLAEYRSLAGYSVSQMSDALCLSEVTLQDLEDEKFENLPQPPYIRGYLRNYAKIADKDPEEIITRYETLRGADPQELEYHFKKSAIIQTRQKKSLSPVLIQVFFLALLLGIIAGITMIPSVNKWIKSTWENFSSQSSTSNIETADNPLLTGTMPVPTPLPILVNEEIEKEGSNTVSQTEQLLENTKSTKNSVNTTGVVEKSNSNKSAQENTVLKAKDDMANSTQELLQAETTNTNNRPIDTINIKLVFNEDVWMRIKDSNNKTVFEGLNPTGNSKVLDLKKPLTFRVGNASGLSLFVDEKLVDISTYIKGSVANFTLE